MSYMDNLLSDLRTHWGIADEEALDFIKSELIKSFKNGIMRGREEKAAGQERRPTKPERRER
jgi:hypothetical protein